MNDLFNPAYLEAYTSGALQEKITKAYERLQRCDFCPNKCHINRLENPEGKCASGLLARIASYKPYFNDDKLFCGQHGSGAIFFAGCNLNCRHCANAGPFHDQHETEAAPEMLADFMIRLQMMGCHNINLISPTHMIYPVLAALPIAIIKGLNIPLIYNTNGYESIETLQLLDGIIDIYSPDLMFMDSKRAQQFSLVQNYREVVQKALPEMFRQVGDLELNNEGIAMRGLMVRHFVFEEHPHESKEAIDFVYQVSPDSVMHIISGYHPYRCITEGIEPQLKDVSPELLNLRNYAQSIGLRRNVLISH